MYEKEFPNSNNEEDKELFIGFMNYLSVAAKRQSALILKKRKQVAENEKSWSEDEQYAADLADPNSADELERILIWNQIQRNLDLLTPKEHEILMCYYFLDLPDRMIAEKFEMTRSALSKCKHRALKKLKDKLEEENHG